MTLFQKNIEILLLGILVGLSVYPVSAKDQNFSNHPKKDCLSKMKGHWTLQEQFVWERVCSEEWADFNAEIRFGGDRDPRLKDDWTSNRALRTRFLKSIILDSEYYEVIPLTGIRISGAWITEKLNLAHAKLKLPLWLVNTRFEKEVNLSFSSSSQVLSLAGSFFKDRVQIVQAQIDNQLVLKGAKFTKILDMNGLTVGTILGMRQGAEFADVVLTSAIIKRQVRMSGSNFSGKLSMNGIRIDEDLMMCAEENLKGDCAKSPANEKYPSRFRDVDLNSATIGGQLELSGASFSGNLELRYLTVGEILFMRNIQIMVPKHIPQKISLTSGKITNELRITGGNLPSLDLTNTKILGTLRIGGSGREPLNKIAWQDGATLILDNAEADSWEFYKDSWPPNLRLSDFKYKHLEGNENNSESRWFLDLLERSEYYPESYHQLALYLTNTGREEMAEDILYSGKERLRVQTHGMERIKLDLLNMFMGYGYGSRKFRSLLILIPFNLWTAFLLTVGITTGTQPQNKFQNPSSSINKVWWFCVYVSLIQSTPQQYIESQSPRIEWTGFFKGWLVFHTIVGTILVSCITIGLLGLVQS